MSKHAADTASTTKKFLAAGGLAFGVASLGLFADIGIAAAHATAPDTGTYDEMTDLAPESCWGGVSSPPVAWEVGDPESAGCEHSRVTASS